MKKTVFVFWVCCLLLLVSCGGTAENPGGILPDPSVTDPLGPGDANEQDDFEQPAEDSSPSVEDETDVTEDPPLPPNEEDTPSETDVDIYVLQSEYGEEVLTIDFYEGTYKLEVNSLHTGSYTATGNHVTLPFFDAQNVWTLYDDGSMVPGHIGEAAEGLTGSFCGNSAYGEYSLTVNEDGTFVFEQDEVSRGTYLIVDGYTILKRDRYEEEQMYLITDRETGTFYYTE